MQIPYRYPAFLKSTKWIRSKSRGNNWWVFRVDIATATFFFLIQYHPQFVFRWKSRRFPPPNACEQKHRPHHHLQFSIKRGEKCEQFWRPSVTSYYSGIPCFIDVPQALAERTEVHNSNTLWYRRSHLFFSCSQPFLVCLGMKELQVPPLDPLSTET